jgi:hypothetical protein
MTRGGTSNLVEDKKEEKTRPAWAGFKTAEEGIAIIKRYFM